MSARWSCETGSFFQRVRPELRGSRYVWGKNPENLNPHQFSLWSELDVKRLNLKTARAYHMRLAFQELYPCEVKVPRPS